VRGERSHPQRAGSQPDLFVVRREPGRTDVLGAPGYHLPTIEEVIAATLLGRRTNPAIRCGGISYDRSKLPPDDAKRLMAADSERLNLPVADPIRGGPHSIAWSKAAWHDRLRNVAHAIAIRRGASMIRLNRYGIAATMPLALLVSGVTSSASAIRAADLAALPYERLRFDGGTRNPRLSFPCSRTSPITS
jgi:hypothetical protein